MKPFEYLEHTADVKFRAYGSTVDEMLSNSASALFNAMMDTSAVQVKESWDVELSADTLERLAYNWLSEIVFLFETEGAVFSTFQVKTHQDGGGGWKLLATIGGERMDPSRHAFEDEVKAITLHQFGIRKDDLWCIQVVLDV
jgi:SHS2 domain-containing protein